MVLHWALVALGWTVVVCGAVRTAGLLRRGLWVRACMVGSWVILAACISLLALLFDDTETGNTAIRGVLVAGLGLGSFGLIAGHFVHDRG